MPPFKPIKRQELIRNLKKLGFSEPQSGGNHQYMIKGQLKLFIEEKLVKTCSLVFCVRQILQEMNGKIFEYS